MSYFKVDHLGQLHETPSLLFPDGTTLDAETRGAHDGWQWFDSLDDAIGALLPQKLTVLLEALATARTLADVQEAAQALLGGA